MWNGRQALAHLKLSQIGNFTLMAEIIGQEGTQLTKSFDVKAHPLTPQMDLSAPSPTMANQLKLVSPHLDEKEGSSLLSESGSTSTSAEMIIASEAFLSTASSAETKIYNSGQHAITVSHVQLSHEEIHLDKGSLPFNIHFSRRGTRHRDQSPERFTHPNKDASSRNCYSGNASRKREFISDISRLVHNHTNVKQP